MKRTLVGGFALLLAACGTITVDDITVMEEDYHHSRDKVLDLAAAELVCPRDQLTTKVLAVTVHANVERLRVSGCEKSAVYLRKGDDFERGPGE